MPEFKENTSPAMKRSGFKMKYQGSPSAFPFKSSPAKDMGHQPPRGEGHTIDSSHSKDDPAAMTGIIGGEKEDMVIDEAGNWAYQQHRPDLMKKKEGREGSSDAPIEKKKKKK